MSISYHHTRTRNWLLVGALTLTPACGDERAGASASQGGSASSSTGGDGRTTGASSSGGGASDSASTTDDAGSNSDSATMASTQGASDPTEGGGSTGAASDSDTTADLSGTDSQASTGDGSSDGSSTGDTGQVDEACMEKDPCNRLCRKNLWTLDEDFDKGVLMGVDHDAPNDDQLQLSGGLLAGEWSVVRDGLVPGATWLKVRHNHEPEGAVPPGTSIVVEVRTADTKAELAARPWVLAVDGALPELTLGRFIELRARLRITDPQVIESPVLSDICVLKQGD